jgi:hypothetical protein
MGGKRGGRWHFLLLILFMTVVAITVCIYGLNYLSHQNTGKGDNNVSSSGRDAREIIDSPVPGAQETPDPTLRPTSSPTPRPSAFTIYAEGGKDHRPGETLRFYGMDTYSDVLYLYLSCMNAPIYGGRLDDPQKPVVDRDAATFTRVNVSEDGSWEYFWPAPGEKPTLLFDLYNVIATAEPRDKPHLDEAADWDMVTVKINR